MSNGGDGFLHSPSYEPGIIIFLLLLWLAVVQIMALPSLRSFFVSHSLKIGTFRK